MRTRILFFLILFSFVLTAQTDLVPEEWREDLRYLQDKVHAEYSALFHNITKEEWDAAVEELYDEIPTLENHEVIVGIARIVALFRIGHTYVNINTWRYNREAAGFQQMPYNLFEFSDGVYVQGVHKDFAEALGARVLRIGNMNIDAAIEAVRKTVSAENDSYWKSFGMFHLGVGEVLAAQGVTNDTAMVTLTLEKDDREFEVEFTPRAAKDLPGHFGLIQTDGDWLDARMPGETPLYLKDLDRLYYFEYLPEHRAVYVRYSQVRDDAEESTPDFFARVFDFVENNDVDRLILDVRLNSGGNNYKVKPIIKGVIRSEKIDQPGKFYVIIGRRTYSACQNLVNRLENYTNVIFVGEPTAENVNFFGDNRTEVLPNSRLPVRLSYLWWQDKDPRDTRQFTPPHLAVEMTFEQYRTNQDPVLETVLQHEATDGVVDPWMHLSDLFNAGKFDELERKAHVFVKDPKYKYFDFQDRLNDAGYQLMQAEMLDIALWTFNLNAELFPDSPNCWDSLAEAHWKSGDLDKARELYNKAIEMDPQGPTGANARAMLKEMEKDN